MKNYLFAITFIVMTVGLTAQELLFEKLENLSFTQPVDMASTYIEGDLRLFIVQKNGFINILNDPEAENPSSTNAPFLNLSDVVNTSSEGGLLGLAFHPNYSENGYFFVNYTFNNPDDSNAFSTRISRFSVDPNDPNLALKDSELSVLTVRQPATNHNGGDLAFGPDGYLYIPLGDGGGANDEFNHGKNRMSLLAKVLRIDINNPPYSIPEDNPFAEDDFTADEIWSLGWRNPWKVAFDRENGDFWAADVGQGKIEEVNIEPFGTPGGRDYGWSCFEGTSEFNLTDCTDASQYTMPIYEYNHNQGQRSITGGFVYRGKRHPDLVGKYIFTDYVDSKVFWITEKISDTEFSTERIQLPSSGAPFRVTTFGESSTGELYFATIQDGSIWKVMTSVVLDTKEAEDIDFTIVPNPAKEIITLQLNRNHITISKLAIYGIDGKSYVPIFIDNLTLDISNIPKGTFILKCEVDGISHQKSFVKF